LFSGQASAPGDVGLVRGAAVLLARVGGEVVALRVTATEKHV